jgi:hypothetical protein
MYREKNIVRGSRFYAFPPRMQIAAKSKEAHDVNRLIISRKRRPEVH